VNSVPNTIIYIADYFRGVPISWFAYNASHNYKFIIILYKHIGAVGISLLTMSYSTNKPCQVAYPRQSHTYKELDVCLGSQ